MNIPEMIREALQETREASLQDPRGRAWMLCRLIERSFPHDSERKDLPNWDYVFSAADQYVFEGRVPKEFRVPLTHGRAWGVCTEPSFDPYLRSRVRRSAEEALRGLGRLLYRNETDSLSDDRAFCVIADLARAVAALRQILPSAAVADLVGDARKFVRPIVFLRDEDKGPFHDWTIERCPNPTQVGGLVEAVRRCRRWGLDWHNPDHRIAAERLEELPDWAKEREDGK